MFTKIESNGKEERLVIVKYFLDRAGYGLSNSSARLWKGAPATCNASAIQSFLEAQGIWEESGILVEVFLDKYETYMALDLMDHGGVVFDYTETSAQNPGILNVRLTDLSSGEADGGAGAAVNSPGFCTFNPIGLFAFSLTVIMETADLYGKLFENSVDPSFVLIW